MIRYFGKEQHAMVISRPDGEQIDRTAGDERNHDGFNDLIPGDRKGKSLI